MPNHISNRVWFESSEEDWLKAETAFAQLRVLMDTDESPFDFNVLAPYPEPYRSLDEARRIAEQLPGVKWSELPKDGFNQGGMEWCRDHWGTKWNAYDIGFDYDTVLFCTAWQTPRPIFAELSSRFPDLRLRVEYASEDRGYNCGKLTYLNGRLIAFEDMSKHPGAIYFARALIAEQRLAYACQCAEQKDAQPVERHPPE